MREHSSILFMRRQSVRKILYVTIMSTVLARYARPQRYWQVCICRGAVDLPVAFVTIAFRFVYMTIVIVSRDLRPTRHCAQRIGAPSSASYYTLTVRRNIIVLNLLYYLMSWDPFLIFRHNGESSPHIPHTVLPARDGQSVVVSRSKIMWSAVC